MRKVIPDENYLVYEDTGEKVVFYECDPGKNADCDKRLCRASCNEENEANFGFCSKTDNPVYAKEGGKKWHAVLKSSEGGEPYWGREYITE